MQRCVQQSRYPLGFVFHEQQQRLLWPSAHDTVLEKSIKKQSLSSCTLEDRFGVSRRKSQNTKSDTWNGVTSASVLSIHFKPASAVADLRGSQNLIICRTLGRSYRTVSTKMKSALFLCTAVAVATLSAIGAESIPNVPKWVDEAKLAYAAEIKSALPPLAVVSA